HVQVAHRGRMKSLTEHLWFEVKGRRGFVNITGTVADLVMKSGVNEGLCLVNAMHITASVFINDNESGLHHDYEVWLEKLAPHAPTSAYRHNRTGATRTTGAALPPGRRKGLHQPSGRTGARGGRSLLHRP